MFPIEIRPPPSIYMRGSRLIEGSNTQSSKNTSTTSLSPSLLLYFSSFFVALHGRWIDDDDEALELLGRLEQPIAATRPDGVPTGRVWGFGSQETSLACLAYSAPGEAPLAMCLASRAHRWRHKVQVWISPRRRPVPKSAKAYIERSSSLSSV